MSRRPQHDETSGHNHRRAVPFDQLQALIAVRDHGSVLAAAKALGISQPAVSNLLRRLEARFAQPLLQSSDGRKTLTAHGEALYGSMMGPVNDTITAYESFQRLCADPSHRKIRVAARREIIERTLSRLSFEGELELQIMGGHQILDALKTRRCDVAIVQRPFVDADFAATDVSSTGVSLVVPRAIAGRATLADLLTEKFFATTPFVAYRRDHPHLAELGEQVGANLQPRNVARLCEDWSLVAAMVEAGVGFTVMPDDFVPHSKACQSFALSPQLLAPIIFRAICLKNLLTMPVVANFITQMQRELGGR